MKTGLGVFFYVLQSLAVVAGVVTDQKRIAAGFPITAKPELLAKINRMAESPAQAGGIVGEWLGFCFLAIIGIGIFAFGLRSRETRNEAIRLIAFGVVVCLASVLWPLAF